ncbi:PTS system, glucitol/sorbitol-specific IIA component [Pilibacter termitis]|uniref:PTS system, glucitol/sorbitol-specific IIA component n=1 Tax=Pilibacter termitis TaxID=263852 RepID=A0A1T4N736_9ENTE|nr:PTS glucitol/sorbitol transporter subunit IIA [Pilibacter termitis]SJZ74648.1 PTS system, glucitol/sorbitol-specific IIA component [Pilibacter termitis]
MEQKEKVKLFETTITAIGIEAEKLAEENMVILFGDEAPDFLADYCYKIILKNLEGEIHAGMTLQIANVPYEIMAVGDVVVKNLNELGHITIKLDGSTNAELPGTLYVEEKELPEITVGTTIAIY